MVKCVEDSEQGQHEDNFAIVIPELDMGPNIRRDAAHKLEMGSV